MAKTGKMRDSETGLTQREELFCQYVIADPSMDLQSAYIKAGFAKSSANVNAYKCFGDAKVQEYYNKLKAERAERLAISADDVLRDIDTIQKSCMQIIQAHTGNGMPLKYQKMVDYANALKACELKGKHIGMFEKAKEIDEDENKTITVKFE